MGRRNRAFFRVSAIDSRTPRDGKIIEKLGHYDPLEKDKSKQIVLNTERIKYWLDKGAIPSDTVSEILRKQGIKTKYGQEKTVRRDRARAIARAKGRPFTKAEKIAAGALTAEGGAPAAEEAEAKKETKPAKVAEAKPKPEEAAEKKPKPEKEEKPA
jgi:small subunit ribosomal protein S16